MLSKIRNAIYRASITVELTVASISDHIKPITEKPSRLSDLENLKDKYPSKNKSIDMIDQTLTYNNVKPPSLQSYINLYDSYNIYYMIKNDESHSKIRYAIMTSKSRDNAENIKWVMKHCTFDFFYHVYNDKEIGEGIVDEIMKEAAVYGDVRYYAYFTTRYVKDTLFHAELARIAIDNDRINILHYIVDNIPLTEDNKTYIIRSCIWASDRHRYTIQDLIRKGFSIMSKRRDFILIAIRENNIRTTEYLLSLSSNEEIINDIELMQNCVERENFNMLYLMRQNGFNFIDNKDVLAVHAIDNDRKIMTKYFTDMGANPLGDYNIGYARSVLNNDIDTVRICLEKYGIHPNDYLSSDINGRDLLMRCLRLGYLEMAVLLYQHDINFVDEKYDNPLGEIFISAVRNKNDKITEYCINNGVSLKYRDNAGLYHALIYNNVWMLKKYFNEGIAGVDDIDKFRKIIEQPYYIDHRRNFNHRCNRKSPDDVLSFLSAYDIVNK